MKGPGNAPSYIGRSVKDAPPTYTARELHIVILSLSLLSHLQWTGSRIDDKNIVERFMQKGNQNTYIVYTKKKELT